MINPHYPKIILSFTYRGFKIEIERDKFNGQDIYAAWVDYEFGSAIAVPFAHTVLDAVKKSKEWVNRRVNCQ
ncbi:MAG: hypothetical protein AAF378_04390 [Cyanobacteria bacterium P01_A01_bin.84]